jgi:hypothetical protein
LDLLCTAVAVELVANLIYFPEEKKPLEKIHKKHPKKIAKTAYKGVTRGNYLAKEDPAASCGCPHAVACPQPTRIALKRGTLKKKKKGKVGRSLFGFFLWSFFFWGRPLDLP